MDGLISDLEFLASTLYAPPTHNDFAAKLIAEAVDALRENRQDLAASFELSLLAECEEMAGRRHVSAALQTASERLKYSNSLVSENVT